MTPDNWDSLLACEIHRRVKIKFSNYAESSENPLDRDLVCLEYDVNISTPLGLPSFF